MGTVTHCPTSMDSPKWDGWILLLHKQGKRMEVYSKNGLTAQFLDLQTIVDQIHADEAILDCKGACFLNNQFLFEAFSSMRNRRIYAKPNSRDVHAPVYVFCV
ncbi:hypothetical protein GCM10025859_66130 [Alicyclobacillus fastidiosus]|nr:hypothetical protein GCM10025859_63930 [Alicyclobacillus fastidiosus]GMA66171.1 hypothetical protein GCM10025859_66130 [Alicyclobacillus fastidiosus]